MNRIFKSDSFKIVVVICVAMSLAAGFAMWGRDGLGIEIQDSGPPVFRISPTYIIERAPENPDGWLNIDTIPSTGCAAARQWASRMGPSPDKIENAVLRQTSGEVDIPSINTPLMAAVVLNDGAEVERLIEGGVDVNEINDKGCTALMWAAMRGNKTILDALLDAGAEVDKSDAAGTTALIIASHTNSVAIVETLVQAGADVNARMKVHIAGGPVPEQQFDAGGTALMKAIMNERLQVSEYLISAEVDVDQADGTGRTALMMAAKANQSAIVELLLAAGADIEKTDFIGQTALIYAVRGIPLILVPTSHPISLSPVIALIGAGADVNIAQHGGQFSAGFTPLLYAANGLRVELVDLLLEAGANVNQTDVTGQTPLMLASQRKTDKDDSKIAISVIKTLLEAGADVNQTDAIGQTALIFAAQGRSVPFIEVLVAAGANINAAQSQDSRFGIPAGSTVLMNAVVYRNPDAVRYLLSVGVMTKLKNAKGQTAIQIALENQYKEEAAILSGGR